tara:strand:- start:686 stop:1252 length:567 start_codon:yes stop_codon:yes gene_type:complete
MFESAAKVFITMLSLLNYAGAPETIVENNICKLSQVAEGIVVNAQSKEEILDLIAVGYIESKFGYRGNRLVSPRGACGVFQQIPRYAYPEDFPLPTCDSLQFPAEASFRASQALRSLKEMYEEDRFCHYNGGNVCSSLAHSYQRAVLRVRSRARRLLRLLENPSRTEQSLHRFEDAQNWCEILERPIE